MAQDDDDEAGEEGDESPERDDVMDDVVDTFVLSDDEEEGMHIEQKNAASRQGKVHGGGIGGRKWASASDTSRAHKKKRKANREFTADPTATVRKLQGEAKSRKK